MNYYCYLVLPANRFFVLLAYGIIAPFCQQMAWEPFDSTGDPMERKKYPIPDIALCSLVHKKMKKNDEEIRNELRAFNWTFEDETTLQLPFSKEPLETVSINLCTASVCLHCL